MDSNEEFPPIELPPLKRQTGRPRRARKRGDDEPPTKKIRLSTVVYAHCKQMGHNKGTCWYAPTRVRVTIRCTYFSYFLSLTVMFVYVLIF